MIGRKNRFVLKKEPLPGQRFFFAVELLVSPTASHGSGLEKWQVFLFGIGKESSEEIRSKPALILGIILFF